MLMSFTTISGPLLSLLLWTFKNGSVSSPGLAGWPFGYHEVTEAGNQRTNSPEVFGVSLSYQQSLCLISHMATKPGAADEWHPE